jgi:hypothetical protein
MSGKRTRNPGTLNTGSLPSVAGFDLKLDVPPVLDGPAYEEAMIGEALRRGATLLQLAEIVQHLRAQRLRDRPDARTPRLHLLTPGPLDFRLDDPPDLLPAVLAYEAQVQREFGGLPPSVQESFAFDKNKSKLAYYGEMRVALYVAGYDDPAAVFSQIKPAKLLGHNVAGGLHQLFLDRLEKLAATLDGWSPGLAARTGKEFKGVGGFVPRHIAPKAGAKRKAPVLSNHAFGLAVDIDPTTNPHIKDAPVIAALNAVVRDLGFDFGKRYLEPDQKIDSVDWVAQTHLLAQQASARVQQWLQKYLPVYDEIQAEQQALKKQAAKPASTPSGPFDPVPAEPTMCKALDPVTLENLDRLKTVLTYHKLAEVRQWAQHGIQTIPLYLAAAMAKIGFGWGQTYCHSKDVMHFELDAKQVLPPDSREPRPLADLQQSVGIPLPVARKTKKAGKQAK